MVCRKPKRPERRFFVILGPEMWCPKGRHKFLSVQGGGAMAPLAPPWIRPYEALDSEQGYTFRCIL